MGIASEGRSVTLIHVQKRAEERGGFLDDLHHFWCYHAGKPEYWHDITAHVYGPTGALIASRINPLFEERGE